MYRLRTSAGTCCLLAVTCSSASLLAQYAPVGPSSSSRMAPASCSTAASPSSGDITVRLTDGLDSATEKVGDYSEAVVTRSTITAVPAGSQAIVQLVADAKAAGFGMQLQQLRVGSTVMCTASSSAALAGGWTARMNNKLRVPGAPRDAVSGAHVFVPESTDVLFTLTAPPAAPPEGPAQEAAGQGSIGSETFDYKKAPLLSIPSVIALVQRFRAVNGVARLKVGAFQGTLNPDAARENVITDGNLPDLPACCFRGVRMAHFNAGETVIVFDVRAFTDGEHDVLHLVMETSFPIFGKVAFVFPKGKLGTMSEPELESLVAAWMTLYTVPIGSSAAAAEPRAGDQWMLVSAQQMAGVSGSGITEFQLRGTTNLVGESRTAYYVLTCGGVQQPSSRSAIRFSRDALKQFDLEPFEGPFVGDGIGDHRKLFRVTVGSSSAPFRNVDGVGGIGTLGGTGEAADTFQLEYTPSQAELRALLGAPGTPVEVTVLPPNGKGKSLTVHFVLPVNQQPLKSYMAPCIHNRTSRAPQ